MSGASRYLIHEILGEGSFGGVYRATLWRSHGLQVEVAIKILRSSVSERMLHRFRDEARVLGLLQHDAIVRVYELTQLDGSWAVAMELVPGIDLAGLCDGHGALPAPVVFYVGERVASALEHAWSHTPAGGSPLRLEHRDIKPANILLTRHGEVKVLDFGIARAVFASREAHTADMSRFGTPPYMAPARWRGRSDEKSDVFGLGVTLMQLLVRHGAPQTSSFVELREWRADLEERVRKVVDPEAADLLASMVVEDTRQRADLATVKAQLRRLGRRPAEVHPVSWAEQVVPRLMDARVRGQGDWSGRDVRAMAPATIELSPTDRHGQGFRELLDRDFEPPEEVTLDDPLHDSVGPAEPSPLTVEHRRSRLPVWVGVFLGSGATLLAVGAVVGVVTLLIGLVALFAQMVG